MKNKSIFISSGHSNTPGRDRGAAGNGYIEGELSVEFRKLLVSELKKLGVTATTDVDNTILSETIAFFKNKVSKDSIVIDIHWNSGPPNATGVEVLVPDPATSIEKTLAYDIAQCIGQTLNISRRGKYQNLEGVKSELESHHGRLGFMRLLGENVLIEMCFISNPNDMKKYQDNKNILATKLAKIIFDYSVASTSIDNTYTVVSGDTLSKIALRYTISVATIKKLNNLTSDIIHIGQKLKVK